MSKLLLVVKKKPAVHGAARFPLRFAHSPGAHNAPCSGLLKEGPSLPVSGGLGAHEPLLLCRSSRLKGPRTLSSAEPRAQPRTPQPDPTAQKKLPEPGSPPQPTASGCKLRSRSEHAQQRRSPPPRPCPGPWPRPCPGPAPSPPLAPPREGHRSRAVPRRKSPQPRIESSWAPPSAIPRPRLRRSASSDLCPLSPDREAKRIRSPLENLKAPWSWRSSVPAHGLPALSGPGPLELQEAAVRVGEHLGLGSQGRAAPGAVVSERACWSQVSLPLGTDPSIPCSWGHRGPSSWPWLPAWPLPARPISC